VEAELINADGQTDEHREANGHISRVSVKKLKCTLVQALRLCTGHTANRGSRGIALLFLDHGTGRG